MIKFPIQNNTNNDTKWVFELVDFKIDKIDVYVPDNSGGYKRYQVGDDIPFQAKRIKHKNFVLPLPDINTPYLIYLKAKVNQNHPYFLFGKITTYEYFTNYALNEYLLLALFYGIIICMVLYNIFLYFNTREMMNLAYIGYIIGLAVFSLSYIDGLGFQYIWPSLPELNEYMAELSVTVFIVGALIFAIYFLETSKYYPGLHKLLLLVIGIRILTGVIITAFPKLDILKIADILFLSLIAIPAYTSFKRKEQVTRHYLISFLLMFAGFLICTFQDYRIIPHTAIGYYSLNIGIIGEVIFLSLAITERTKLLILQKNQEQYEKIQHLKENEKLKSNLIEELQEKERLKDKVNLELESKVAGRTRELKNKSDLLEELNVELENQAKEIYRMASILDKQNWNLKKELKNESIARVTNEVLEFDEFFKIYPAEMTCYHYISDLKWSKGFKCKKCSHDKFSIKKTDLSRKCTKCSTIESVTDSTIFHGIRFPLNKAFYIVYMAMHTSGKTNILKLSEKLEIQPATCCRFFLFRKREERDGKTKIKSGSVAIFGYAYFIGKYLRIKDIILTGLVYQRKNVGGQVLRITFLDVLFALMHTSLFSHVVSIYEGIELWQP